LARAIWSMWMHLNKLITGRMSLTSSLVLPGNFGQSRLNQSRRSTAPHWICALTNILILLVLFSHYYQIESTNFNSLNGLDLCTGTFFHKEVNKSFFILSEKSRREDLYIGPYNGRDSKQFLPKPKPCLENKIQTERSLEYNTFIFPSEEKTPKMEKENGWHIPKKGNR